MFWVFMRINKYVGGGYFCLIGQWRSDRKWVGEKEENGIKKGSQGKIRTRDEHPRATAPYVAAHKAIGADICMNF